MSQDLLDVALHKMDLTDRAELFELLEEMLSDVKREKHAFWKTRIQELNDSNSQDRTDNE
jgi:BMFP domain-containing protein YqiC